MPILNAVDLELDPRGVDLLRRVLGPARGEPRGREGFRLAADSQDGGARRVTRESRPLALVILDARR